MELLGYVMLGTGNISGASTSRSLKMSIVGNPGEPTAYGITKNTISVIKANELIELRDDTNKKTNNNRLLVATSINDLKSKKFAINTPRTKLYKRNDIKNTNVPLIKIKPIRANSALAIAHGLNIELGRSMQELIEVITSAESLYLVRKIRERNSKVLWSVSRLNAGSVPSFEIGSLLTANDVILRFVPNSDLRTDPAYTSVVPLTTLNTLALKSDFKSDGYSSRYIQIMLSIARPMKWTVTGVVEVGDTMVYVKVKNEIGEYKYCFTVDRDNPEFMRLTDITLICDMIK